MIDRLLPLPVPPEIRDIAAQFARDFAAVAAQRHDCPYCAPALYRQLAASPLCLIERDTLLTLYGIACAVQSDTDRMSRQWGVLAGWLRQIVLDDQVLRAMLAALCDDQLGTRH